MGKSSTSKLTKEEKEALKQKRNFESKELCKNYFDSSPLKLSRGDITLKQLRLGTILSHDLKAVVVDCDTIELKSSWVEFILIMLSQLIETKDNFKDILGKFQITNQNFYVEKVYGNYSFDTQGYTVYKIYDTGYYLEAKLNERSIFLAIAKLIRALELNPKSIKFRVVSKKITKEDIIKESVNYRVESVNIEDAYERFEKNENITYIKINKQTEKVNRLDVALLIMCNVIYDEYGINRLTSIQNTEQTGICLVTSSIEYPKARIKDSLLHVYTTGDYESILEFMQNTEDLLDLHIEFGFKARNQIKHEWEVD